MTNPEFFKDVTEEKLNDLLMGDNNVPCPMIKDRLKVLHGDVLCLQYVFLKEEKMTIC